MRMENEGPRMPLKGRRRDTAAEQMSQQQQQYEERGRPVRDEAQHAAAHNETHPKLKRELDKRRSVTEFLDCPEKRICLRHADPTRGIKRYETRKRSAHRNLERPRQSRHSRTNNRMGKQGKGANSKRVRRHVCKKKGGNFCIYVVNRRIGTESLPLDRETPVAIGTPKPSTNQCSKHSRVHTPVSRTRSVSSYNSFYSSEHEPMV